MALKKINLGTAPTGVGGDTNRTANEKMNLNIDEIELTFESKVDNSTVSTTPASGKIPLANAQGNINIDWIGFTPLGKEVATGTRAQGREALQLGTAATRDSTTARDDATSGRLMRVGDGGLLVKGSGTEPANETLSEFPSGMWVTRNGFLCPENIGPNHKPTLLVKTLDTRAFALYSQGADTSGSYNRLWFTAFNGEPEGPFTAAEFYHTDNATVDSNGFIKEASPILKLHSDRIASNDDDAPAFERIDAGHYRLSNTNGLRLDDGWYIETPHDKNGNKYFNVEWEQDSTPTTESGILEEPDDVTLTIRCYERVWNPQTGTYDNGDPVDIPDGRWIDLRMNEVRQPESEDIEEPETQPAPTEPSGPVIPSVVTMAQAKLALYYAGMLEAVEAMLSDLPEPDKTLALIEWNHRQTIERGHPLVTQVAAALELTEEQLDDLFVDAAGR